MAEHLRLSWEDQERSGTACYVLCLQDSCGLPLQRKAQTQKEIYHCKCLTFCYFSYLTVNLSQL